MSYATHLEYLRTQVKRFLPEPWADRDDVLGAVLGPLARVLELGDSWAPVATIGGAEDEWLTLLARGFGLVRGTDEPDASLRARIRNVDEALTKASLEAAVNALLAPYSYAGVPAYIVEHWAAGPACDLEDGELGFICDVSHLYGEHNAFTLWVPLVESDEAHPIYAAIYQEVERLRAAGVRWWMVLQA